jgi:hypothetical protein
MPTIESRGKYMREQWKALATHNLKEGEIVVQRKIAQGAEPSNAKQRVDEGGSKICTDCESQIEVE